MLRLNKFNRAAIPLTAATVLMVGNAACSSETAPDTAPPNPAPFASGRQACGEIAGLTNVRLIGASKDGGYNAVNAGNCATAFEPTGLAITGTLPAETAFVATCVNPDSKPIGLGITAPEGVTGQVRATEAVIDQFAGLVPEC